MRAKQISRLKERLNQAFYQDYKKYIPEGKELHKTRLHNAIKHARDKALWKVLLVYLKGNRITDVYNVFINCFPGRQPTSFNGFYKRYKKLRQPNYRAKKVAPPNSLKLTDLLKSYIKVLAGMPVESEKRPLTIDEIKWRVNMMARANKLKPVKEGTIANYIRKLRRENTNPHIKY